jgi:hypothetical protein
MARLMMSRLTRRAVVERADGQCECDIATHDHGSNECHRRPKHIVYKEDAVHVPLPENLMAVCSPCYSQIRYERG